MRGDLPRKTLDELAARYELEPTLWDVYVEGSTDAGFIAWFLDSSGLRNVAVYEADAIEVPDELVVAANQDIGARGRVITLALSLADRVGSHAPVVCLVDEDCNPLFGDLPDTPLLIHTDFAAMELYAFDARTVQKVFNLVGARDLDARDALEQLSPMLVDLFLVKAASRRLGSRAGEMSFDSCCEVGRGRIRFDAGTYVTRYAGRPTFDPTKEALDDVVEELRAIVSGDLRRFIDGEHFVLALVLFLRPVGSARAYRDPKVMQKLLYGSLELEELTSHQMFQELIGRVTQ